MQGRTGPAVAQARRGRPRDPTIESRIFDAALTLYAAQGWQGFNFDSVARTAGIGKDAIYRRWATREALLEETLRQRWEWVAAVDEGSFRADLLQLGRLTLQVFAGPYGEVALQLRADARRFDALSGLVQMYRERLVLQGRGIVRRAIDRGEFQAGASPGLIMDLLIGAIINHIVSTPPRLRSRMLDQAGRFVEDVVEIIMIGAEHLASRRAGSP